MHTASCLECKAGWKRHSNSTPTLANGVVFVGEGNGAESTPITLQPALPSGRGTRLLLLLFAAPVVARGTLYTGSWDGFAGSNNGTIRAFRLARLPPLQFFSGIKPLRVR